MSKRLTALAILGGIAAAANTANAIDEIANRTNERVVYVERRPVTTPRYERGGQPQRGYYSTPVFEIYTETAETIVDIANACDGKLRSIGRELAYQIHRAEKSGWHDAYHCSHTARRDIIRMAEYLGVSHIRPHDSDYQYERLAEEIISLARRARKV